MTADPPRRVLIVKPSSLGDVVTAAPVLRALRRAFPEAHLAWLLTPGCAPLVAEDTDLDEVIEFDRRRLGAAWRSVGAFRDLRKLVRRLRHGGFDWAIDLQGLFRSGYFTRVTRAPRRIGFADAREGATVFYTERIAVEPTHTVERNIALAGQLGLDAGPGDMRLAVTDAGNAFVGQLCAQRGLERSGYLVCVPPTRWATKRYPVRHWRAVVRRLVGHVPVVLLGAPGDEALCGAVAEGIGGVVDLAGRTDVAEMVGVIAASAGVVCSDSAAKFIAPAVGVDTVTLIGPTLVAVTGPYPHGTALVADIPCAGCRKKTCRHVTCMQSIRPDDVVAAAESMIEARVS
jgi:lipopolysaccharide heptosyltransferase I